MPTHSKDTGAGSFREQGQGQGQGQPQPGQGRPQPRWPRDDTRYDTPDSSDESKFEDLEAMSRQQRRNQVRGKRSRGAGRGDLDRDW